MHFFDSSMLYSGRLCRSNPSNTGRLRPQNPKSRPPASRGVPAWCPADRSVWNLEFQRFRPAGRDADRTVWNLVPQMASARPWLCKRMRFRESQHTWFDPLDQAGRTVWHLAFQKVRPARRPAGRTTWHLPVPIVKPTSSSRQAQGSSYRGAIRMKSKALPFLTRFAISNTTCNPHALMEHIGEIICNAYILQ